eukprot:762667-Hanusia_phi.AAC.3
MGILYPLCRSGKEYRSLLRSKRERRELGKSTATHTNAAISIISTIEYNIMSMLCPPSQPS